MEDPEILETTNTHTKTRVQNNLKDIGHWRKTVLQHPREKNFSFLRNKWHNYVKFNTKRRSNPLVQAALLLARHVYSITLRNTFLHFEPSKLDRERMAFYFLRLCGANWPWNFIESIYNFFRSWVCPTNNLSPKRDIGPDSIMLDRYPKSPEMWSIDILAISFLGIHQGFAERRSRCTNMLVSFNRFNAQIWEMYS